MTIDIDQLHLAKMHRNFFDRLLGEQEIILTDIYCNHCQYRALGYHDIREFERDGIALVTATCPRCGGTIEHEVSYLLT